MDDKRPIIGVTLGDPAGIGPEITIKAMADSEIYRICKPLIIGDSKFLYEALKVLNINNMQIHTLNTVNEAKFEYGTIDIMETGSSDLDEVKAGQVSKEAGEAAFQCVKKVITLALAKEVDATVTNPINKEAINLAGHKYSGHTEIYADFTNTKKYTMMLAYENLKVVHVTTHVSLRQACELVKKERVLEVIRIANETCRDLGIENPRIAVAGLNPHSGENGMFGTEEIEEISPAIEEAKKENINADGPIPPDTIFSKARGGMYDIVVAMYHDQGHIPLKVVGFVYNAQKEKWDSVAGVNITLGLPIIRTSVDHGTAFDQAGKGTASEESLVNAIKYAVMLTKNKNGGIE